MCVLPLRHDLTHLVLGEVCFCSLLEGYLCEAHPLLLLVCGLKGHQAATESLLLFLALKEVERGVRVRELRKLSERGNECDEEGDKEK